MAGSQRRRFTTRRTSKVDRIRRSQRGAKLTCHSSSDGSPERPVKVVVVGGDVGLGGDGSPVCVPVFGGDGRIPRSSDKIGEGGPSSAPVPKMCDGGGRAKEPVEMGAGGGGRSKEVVKLGAGGGGRSKEVVKLGAGCSDGSPELPIKVCRSRLRIDKLGQYIVLDSEEEDPDLEAGLYAPDSEEEDGGCYGGLRQLHQRAILPEGGDAAAGYYRGRAVVASADSKEVTMVANPAVAVARAVDPAGKVVTDHAAMDVPVGAAIADELHPEVAQHLNALRPKVAQFLKEIMYWTWYCM